MRITMKLSDYRVYPVTAIDGDGNGIYTISIDGIPGATTEARENKIDEWALAAFVDISEARLQRHQIVPAAPRPKEGQRTLTVPVVTAMKVMLWSAMNERGITRAELARRLGVIPQSVVQLFSLSRKNSSVETLVRAFEAIGMTVEFTAE
jgi:antitoxin HicB